MRALCALLCCALPLAVGCRLDVTRIRGGRPLDVETFEELRVGESTRDEALEKLGAPDRERWETDRARLFWDYTDDTNVNLRFQLPIALLGYRHNLFQYFQGQDQANDMELVFSERGQLLEKSLRLPEDYRAEDRAAWRLHLAPRFEHSFLLAGSAGFEDYSEAFRNGYVAGADVGFQPVPPVIVSLGGTYQEYQGKGFAYEDGGQTLPGALGDLRIYGVEAKVRLQIPVGRLLDSDTVGELWKLMLDSDPSRHDGFIVFAEGGLGGAVNDNVEVAIDGVPRGRLYDNVWQLTSSGTAGIEYSMSRVSVRAGVTFRTMDAFDPGSSPVDSAADAFQAWLGTVSLSVKF